jgi:hypothetical protein
MGAHHVLIAYSITLVRLEGHQRALSSNTSDVHNRLYYTNRQFVYLKNSCGGSMWSVECVC